MLLRFSIMPSKFCVKDFIYYSLVLYLVPCISTSEKLKSVTKHFNATDKIETSQKKSVQVISKYLKATKHKNQNRITNTGDLNALNAIFDEIVFSIPNTSFKLDFGGIWGSAGVDLYDMSCYDFDVGYVQASHEKINYKLYYYNIDIDGVAFKCTFNYRLDYGGIKRGEGYFRFENTSVFTKVKIRSSNFNYFPPMEASTETCTADINIGDIDLWGGGLYGFLANAFEELMRDSVEDEVRKVLCTEINSFGSNEFKEIVLLFSQYVSNYFGNIPADDLDPLSAQKVLSSNEDLFDLQISDDPKGDLFRDQLNDFLASLGKRIAPNKEDRPDLTINLKLREFLLDSNGIYTIKPVDKEWIIYEGHDVLSKSHVSVENIRIEGLDSLIRFDPLNTIGPQTLQTHAFWKFLNFEVDLLVQIKASTLENSLILETGSKEVTNRVTVSFQVENVDSRISFLSAFSKQKFGLLELGMILQNLPLCLLSTFYKIELTEFHMTAESYKPPSIEGFVSPGMDSFIYDTIIALNSMYEGSINRAMAKWFALDGKKKLNNLLSDFLNDANNIKCPQIIDDAIVNDMVNWNTLLLGHPLLDASEKDPYPLEMWASHLITQFYDALMEPGKINDIIVKLTKSQSNEGGKLIFPEQILSLPFLPNTRFSLHADNIDSIGVPISFMQPDENYPYILKNQFKVGVGNDAIRFNLRVNFPLKEYGSMLQANGIEISIEAQEMEVQSSIIAMLNESNFLRFPMEHLSNFFCWIATLTSLEMDSFSFGSFEAMEAKVTCISCTNDGFVEIPSIVGVLKSVGIIDKITKKFMKVIELIFESKVVDDAFAYFLGHASQKCPYHPMYQRIDVSQAYESFTPSLDISQSEELLDFLILLGGVSSPIAIVVSALSIDEAAYKSKDEEIDIMYENAFDLRKLNDIVTLLVKPAIENVAFKQLESQSKDIGINQLVQDLVYNEKESFVISLAEKDISFNITEYSCELSELRLKGLDNFSSLDIFNIITEKKVESSGQIDELKIEVDFLFRRNFVPYDITSYPTNSAIKKISLELMVTNFNIFSALDFAFDVEKLKELKLGSFLNFDEILPCVLGTKYKVGVQYIDINFDNIEKVNVKGFISKQTKKIISESILILLKKYKEDVVNLLSLKARTSLSIFLNNFEATQRCQEERKTDASSDFVNLHHLLTTKDDYSSKRLYGNVIPTVKAVVNRKISEPEAFNDLIIEPITKFQSNETGTLFFNDELLTMMIGDTTLNLFDAQINNLNSFGVPKQFLDPDELNPYVLNNDFTLGVGNQSLNAFAALQLTLKNVSNILDVSMELRGVHITSSILVKACEQDFLDFAFGNMFNAACWLDIIPSIALDEDGLPEKNFTAFLGLENFTFSKIEAMTIDVNCKSCVSEGIKELPNMIGILKSSGVMQNILVRFLKFIEESLNSETFDVYFARMVQKSSGLCSNDRSNQLEGISKKIFGLPPIHFSEESMDFMILIAGVTSQIFVCAAALHASSIGSFHSNNNIFLDTRYEDSVDFLLYKEVIDDVVKPMLGKFLVNTKERSSDDIPINEFLKSYILNDQGIFVWPQVHLNLFTFQHYSVKLIEIRMKGLDSTVEFEMLNITSKHDINNALKMLSLGVEIDISIDDMVERRTLTIGMDFEDISLSFSLLLNVDEKKLSTLEIFSLLTAKENILPCILDSIQIFNITSFTLSFGNIKDIRFEGFISSDTKTMLSKSVEIYVERYGDTILAATSIYAKTLLMNYFSKERNKTCKMFNTVDTEHFVNVKSLLQGSDYYGSNFAKIYNVLQWIFLQPDAINSLIIEPLTKFQSTEAGTIALNQMEFKSDVFGRIWQVFDLKFENLNSFGVSQQMFVPDEINPYVLHSRMPLGEGNEALRASSFLKLLVSGNEGKMLANEIGIKVEIRKFQLITSTFIKILELNFFKFPLANFMDPLCWFTMLPQSGLDDKGIPQDDFISYLSIQELQFLDVDEISLEVDCFSCQSKGMKELPFMIDLLKSSGLMKIILNRLLKFVGEGLESTSMEVALARFVDYASQSCSHDKLYNNKFEKSKHDPLYIPVETEESFDFLVMVGGLGSQIALAVMALDGIGVYVNAKDTDSRISKGETSFLNLEGFKSILNKYIKPPLEDVVRSSSKPHQDLGINSMISSWLLDESREYKLNLDRMTFESSGYRIDLEEVRLLGLDSFIGLNIFDISSKYRMKNKLDLEYVGIELDVLIHIPHSKYSHARNLNYNEEKEVTLYLNVSKIELDLWVDLYVGEEDFNNIQLRSLLNVNQILPCIMESVYYIDVNKLAFRFDEINKIGIKGFVSEETKVTFSAFARLMIDSYKEEFISWIQNRMRGEIFKTFIEHKSKRSCSNFTVNDTFLDFRDLLLNRSDAINLGGSGTYPYGELIMLINSFIQDEVFAPGQGGDPKVNGMVNDIVAFMLASDDGELEFQEKLLDLNGERFDFAIKSIQVQNLDSFGYPLRLINPVQGKANVVENVITIGAGLNPLNLTAKVYLAAEGYNILNELDVMLQFSNTTIFLPVLAKVDSKTFLEYPIREYNNIYCWIATIPAPSFNNPETLSIQSFNLTYEDITLTIDCVNCTNPNLQRISALSGFLQNPEKVSGAIRNFVTGDFLKDIIVETQIKAMEECPFYAALSESATFDSTSSSILKSFRPPTFTDESFQKTFGIVGVVMFWMLVVSIMSCVVRLNKFYCHKKWLYQSTNNEICKAYERQLQIKQDEHELSRVTSSLVRSSDISLTLRILLPHVVLVNVGLFLMGHFSLGVSLDIFGEVIGEQIKLPRFFHFSIFNSVFDLWDANAKVLAITVAIFSGVWPYVKQLITLFLWFIPPSIVGVTTRGNIFWWLDILTKWSMMDIFVLITTTVAFRLVIRNPDVLPEDFYKVDLLVVPLWGFYANMIAQIISQVTSHVVIYYQRRIVHNGKIKIKETRQLLAQEKNPVFDDVSSLSNISSKLCNQNKKSKEGPKDVHIILNDASCLCNHKFHLNGLKEGIRKEIRPYTNKVVVVTACLSVTMLFLGIILPSLHLEILGVLGLMVEAGNEFNEAKTGHSIFSIIKLLIDQALFLDLPHHYVGLGTLSLLLAITSAVIPTVLVSIMMFMWFLPMTTRGRKTLLMWVNGLKAWQYIEVYVVSLLLASWQLGQISSFMFDNEYCNDFTQHFSKLTHYGIVKEDDAQCFNEKASIGIGLYFLTVSSILISWLSNFVVSAALQKHEDDDSLEYNPTITINQETSKNMNKSINLKKKVRSPKVKFSDSYWMLLKKCKALNDEISHLEDLSDSSSFSSNIDVMEYQVKNYLKTHEVLTPSFSYNNSQKKCEDVKVKKDAKKKISHFST